MGIEQPKASKEQWLAALRETTKRSMEFSQAYSARRDTPEKRAELNKKGEEMSRRIQNAAAITQHRIDLGLTVQEYDMFIHNGGLR